MSRNGSTPEITEGYRRPVKCCMPARPGLSTGIPIHDSAILPGRRVRRIPDRFSPECRCTLDLAAVVDEFDPIYEILTQLATTTSR